MVENFCNEVLLKKCGIMLVGFSSDGDARRFTLQRSDTVIGGQNDVGYRLDHPMVTYGSKKVTWLHADAINLKFEVPFTVKNIHSQDPIQKKPKPILTPG
jgi:hypothetical protein